MNTSTETSSFLVCSRCRTPVGSAAAKSCAWCGAVFAESAPSRDELLPKRTPVGGIITPQ